jgi:hypothetical protein
MIRFLSTPSVLLVVALLIGLSAAGPAQAQSVYEGPIDHSDRVSIEWTRPSLDDNGVYGYFTSTLFVSGQFSVSETVQIVGELPFSYASAEAGNVEESSFKLANPYVGLDWRNGEKSFLELGLVLPAIDQASFADLAGPGAIAISFLTNLDRPEYFIPDFLSVRALQNLVIENDDQTVQARLRIGPVLAINTGDSGFSDDTELLSNIDAFVWYVDDRFEIGGGFTNDFVLTDEGSAADRSQSTVGAAAFFTFDQIEPGLSLRVPLDEDASELLNYTFGLTARIPLN